MLIIGCDYHPSFQQIACVDTETGECDERRLAHSNGEAEKLYRGLNGQGVRVGIEATGHVRWFERLPAELKYELWVGPGPDSGHASPKAEDRPPGRATSTQGASGRSFSPRVGSESGESGSAPTALASASAGADADAGDESVASHRPQRGDAAQEGTVEQAGGSNWSRSDWLPGPSGAGGICWNCCRASTRASRS